MITCIICPKGCKLSIKDENGKYIITGNGCHRGVTYGMDEMTHPKRKITTTVQIISSYKKRLPVISEQEIDKDIMMEVVKELKKISVKPPILMNQVIVENILNTGVNIIASKTIQF